MHLERHMAHDHITLRHRILRGFLERGLEKEELACVLYLEDGTQWGLKVCSMMGQEYRGKGRR